MVNKKARGAKRSYMIRNTYEDTIFVITSKLNEKLDDLLSIPKDSKCITIDNDILELAKITAKYNSLLMEVINRNTMIKEFVSERDYH